MVKKSTALEISKVDNVDNFALTDAATALAARFGLNLADTKEARIDRAALNMNRSMHAMVAAGLDLASLQADCEHGEFLALIQERGFEQRGAYRAISYTRFLLSRSEEERELLLSMPKSKVLALASADADVINDLLADGDGDLDALSVRDLRTRIRELEARGTDLSVQVEKAEADRDGALKKLKRRSRDEEDTGVPLVVADIRAEVAALVKKAELAVTSMYPVFVEAYGLRSHEQASDWVDPTLRLALSGLLALREQIDGSIKSVVEALGEKAKLRETNVADERAAVRLAERVVLVDGQHKLLVSDADFRYAMTFMHIDAFECDGQRLPQAVLSLDVFGKISTHDLQKIEERVVLMELAAQVRYGLLSQADFEAYMSGQKTDTAPPQPVGQTAAVGATALPAEFGPALLADYSGAAASGAAAGHGQTPA